MFIKIIIILSLYNAYKFQTTIYNPETIYLYPEEKIKMKNVCAIYGQTKRIIGTTTIYNNYMYLKTHCSRNEKCYETEPGYFQCGKKINLQKIGKDCGVNEECYTGLCNYGKCASINDDEECTVENDPSNPEKVCNPGHWCHEYDSLNHLYKCVPYVGEGELYDEIDGKKCKIGLRPFQDASLFKKCTKVGSLKDGTDCTDPLLCENGDTIGYDPDTEELSTDESKKKCFSVVTDSPCVYDIDESDYFCKPIVDGLDIYVVEIKIPCIHINDDHICPYSKGRQKCFKEYISELNGLNVDEVYKDEDKYHKKGYGNNKLSKAYQKFMNYYDLYSMGFIDDNGDITENKKDEWEFYWRINNSFMIHFSYFFYLIVLLLF
jgi:hypothetical protein